MLTSNSIGSKIATARKNANLSQAELAQQVSISPQAVGKWERGESMPDISTLNRIAEIMGVDLNFFSESFSSDEIKKAPSETSEADNGFFVKIKTNLGLNWNLSGDSYVDADFSGLNNVNDKLSGSSFKRCKFVESDLSNISFKGNSIIECDFQKANLQNSTVYGSELKENSFQEALLMDARIEASEIRNSTFINSNLSKLEVNSSEFRNNNMENVILKQVAFKETQFTEMVFSGLLENCTFSQCSFSKTMFFKIEANDFEKSKTKPGRGSTDVQNVLVIAESTPLEDPNGSKSSRFGYFKIKVMKNHQAEEITKAVIELIEPESIVFADKSTSYVDLKDIVEGHYTELSSEETTKRTLKWAHIAISNAKRVLNGIYKKN